MATDSPPSDSDHPLLSPSPTPSSSSPLREQECMICRQELSSSRAETECRGCRKVFHYSCYQRYAMNYPNNGCAHCRYGARETTNSSNSSNPSNPINLSNQSYVPLGDQNLRPLMFIFSPPAPYGGAAPVDPLLQQAMQYKCMFWCIFVMIVISIPFSVYQVCPYGGIASLGTFGLAIFFDCKKPPPSLRFAYNALLIIFGVTNLFYFIFALAPVVSLALIVAGFEGSLLGICFTFYRRLNRTIRELSNPAVNP